jgi:hypothetical protein
MSIIHNKIHIMKIDVIKVNQEMNTHNQLITIQKNM